MLATALYPDALLPTSVMVQTKSPTGTTLSPRGAMFAYCGFAYCGFAYCGFAYCGFAYCGLAYCGFAYWGLETLALWISFVPRLRLVTEGAVGSLSKKTVVAAPFVTGCPPLKPKSLYCRTDTLNGANGNDVPQLEQYT